MIPSMDSRLIVIGAGGHGLVVIDALLSAGETIAGIIDPRLPAGDRLWDIEILGGDEVLKRLDAAGVRVVNGVGANPRTDVRRRVFDDARARGFRVHAVRHPAAVVRREVAVGEGSQIMAGATVQPGVTIGANAVINTGACIDHDCVLEAHVFVSPGAVLSGTVTVGEGAFIGAGAVVIPGVRIGATAIVGAGAVVTRDVAAGVTVVGNPARPASRGAGY